MQAKEAVGKARLRLSMLRMPQGLRVPQGCLTPRQGWRVTPPFLLPLLWGAPLAPLAAPRPLPGFRSGRERRLGGSLGGGLAMRVRVVGVRPQGGLCSSSPLPPPLPAWGRADPRVTGEAARRARAEA